MTELTLSVKYSFTFTQDGVRILTMDEVKQVGDRIKVLAHAVLGTPESMGTILEVNSDHYIVHIDGDDPTWFGPVSLNGEVLS